MLCQYFTVGHCILYQYIIGCAWNGDFKQLEISEFDEILFKSSSDQFAELISYFSATWEILGHSVGDCLLLDFTLGIGDELVLVVLIGVSIIEWLHELSSHFVAHATCNTNDRAFRRLRVNRSLIPSWAKMNVLKVGWERDEGVYKACIITSRKVDFSAEFLGVDILLNASLVKRDLGEWKSKQEDGDEAGNSEEYKQTPEQLPHCIFI